MFFLSLSAIEYGELIGPERIYIPITIVYICIGLAISTIALDIGSSYVRVLFYYTKKIGNVANTHIWFGSKKLQVKDLLSAIGQNIGIEPDVLLNIDIEGVINVSYFYFISIY
uniref:Ion_trans_2 domain-containing protein n=1 Tax=Rhabditophanes sp. KR3021 TaxID=114890 RepID=A0AC35TML1_9BILA